MFRILRSGKNIGDAAALKLSLLGDREDESSYTQRVLATRAKNFELIETAALLDYPENSFGRAYAEFMRRNALKPFNFSQRVHELFSRFPVSMRYVRIHDMVHVLLGFETDISGELWVYAFIGEQNYNRTLNKAARAARLMGHLMFWNRVRVREVQERGGSLAAGAKVLIAEPLEDKLDRPLDELRVELGLSL